MAMNNYRKHNWWMVSVAALMLALLACTCGQVQGQVDAPTPELFPTLATDGGDELSQWASSANASSEYTPTDWSALQATGAPDTTGCGDLITAWASGSAAGVDWIELSYPVAVIPTRIDIYQTYNPGAIVKVEVVDAQGTAHSVYESQSKTVSDCPTIQTIDLAQEGIDFLVAKLIISVDQTNHPGWDEIDAVQLTGTP
jgi:hypothetical protein